ncbi:MAG: hypothetical protein EXS08_16765 [Planctomycetes bacterium]|nr:hypothetical protein [Planctomycetota bacterium]
MQRLFSPSGARDIFGYEIALAGEHLLAVAPAETDFATFQIGALYLYRRDLGGPSAWGLERRLVDPQADGFFAADEVELRGDWIVAGSFSLQSDGEAAAGALCVFGRNVGGENAWGALGRIGAAQLEADALFGLDLKLEGDELLVGAPGSYGGAASGELYVLDLGRVARASWRTDAGRVNRDVYRARTQPWLGMNYVAEVDLRPSGHGSRC